MEENKQTDIVIYPSALKAFSYIAFGLILLITGISFISTDKQIIYIIISFVLGAAAAVYGIINLVLKNRPFAFFGHCAETIQSDAVQIGTVMPSP